MNPNAATQTDDPRSRFMGYGLGLRPKHYADFLAAPQAVDWLEIISENYMIQGGKPLTMLEAIRGDYPIVTHGVSMSIGSVQPLNLDYLKTLKQFAGRFEPEWISDHLCWTGVHGVNLYDLYPLPYTEEALKHVVGRIRQVQDILGRRLVIENVSSYISYADSVMTEWAFIAAIAEQADCLLLLDVNNIYVSSFNHGFNPKTFIDHIPKNRVQQIHLAGHSNTGNFIIDTHDAPIIDPVFDLYAYACQRFGQVSTMIERDDKIPPLPELIAELNRVRKISADNITNTQAEKAPCLA